MNLPLEFVEKLLDTEYHNYKHEDGSIVARTTHWSLPRHLHSHIDVIQPTTSFFRGTPDSATYVKTIDEVHDEIARLSVASSNGYPTEISKVCNVSSVTPECFATLYKTKGYETKAAKKNSIGFANYLEEVSIPPQHIILWPWLTFLFHRSPSDPTLRSSCKSTAPRPCLQPRHSRPTPSTAAH